MMSKPSLSSDLDDLHDEILFKENSPRKIYRAIKVFAMLGLATVTLLALWIGLQRPKLQQLNSVQESFGSDNTLQILVSYPQYMAYGETGVLQILAKNTGQYTFRNVQVAVTTTGLTWFQPSSQITFKSLAPGTQSTESLQFSVVKLPDTTELDLAPVVQFTQLITLPQTITVTQLTAGNFETSVLTTTNTIIDPMQNLSLFDPTIHQVTITQTVPLTRSIQITVGSLNRFQEPVTIQISPLKEKLLVLTKLRASLNDNIPGLVSIISATTLFLTGIIALQGKLVEVVGFLTAPFSIEKTKVSPRNDIPLNKLAE